MQTTCYMCNSPATSSEHAPPKCIFPKKEELPSGEDLRKNLITVPACDVHNTLRSKDDEYLLYVLPPSLGSNPTGSNLFLSRVLRTINRRPALAKSLVENAKTIRVHNTATDEWLDDFALPIDAKRLHRVIEMNARAIYFHHHGQRFDGETQVFNNFTLNTDPSFNEKNEKIFEISDNFLQDVQINGDNPSVFTYRITRYADNEFLEFCYFGRNKALIVFNHKPKNGTPTI